MKRRTGLIALLLMLCMESVQAQHYALLVGVGDYQYPEMTDLQGPPEDVAALKRVLMAHWDLAEQNLLTLVDQQATKQRIVDEIRSLGRRLSAKDQLLIYFSGHGTSRGDSMMWGPDSPIAPGSGAFMPYDAVPVGERAKVMASLLMTNQDLLPVLDEVDRSGAETLVIADSCYSGHTVRAVRGDLISRQQRLYFSDQTDTALQTPISASVSKIPPYRFKNITYLAAASEGEQAIDIGVQNLRQFPTLDDRPHGAFTDGLLRMLSGQVAADADGDGRISHLELRDASHLLLNSMGLNGRGLSHTPQLHPAEHEQQHHLRLGSLFAARSIGVSAAWGKPSPLRVSLAEGMAELELALRRQPWAQWVAEGGDVQMVSQAGVWRLLSSAGDTIGQIPAGNIPLAIQRLGLMHWVHELAWRQTRANALRLQLAVEPEAKGGNFLFGDFLNIRLKVNRPAWLVLLNVAGGGDIEPLYPFTRAELEPLLADRNLFLPDPDPRKSICVRGPEGTDHLIALAFAQRPPLLEQLVGQKVLRFDDPAILRWRSLIQQDTTGQAISAAVIPIRILKGDGRCAN